LLTKTLMKMI